MLYISEEVDLYELTKKMLNLKIHTAWYHLVILTHTHKMDTKKE